MHRLRILVFCFGIVATLLLLVLALFAWRPGWFLGLDASRLQARGLAPSSFILDRNDLALYELIDPHAGSHRPARLEEMPLALRQAIIATEDATFYANPGVEPRAIVRALWMNLRRGEVLSGGSTITQQLARNLLLGAAERTEITLRRKLREALLAYYLTRTLGKDGILALYLNETYFGNQAYGVEAAARAYFGKPVSQLDLAECALLAGLPQAPSVYNPLTNLPGAKARQRSVLDLMLKEGYITREQAELAHAEPLHFASTPFTIQAPHFCMLVREELAQRLGEETLRQGGLRVHTTLDLYLQQAAEGHVQRHLAKLNEPSRDMPGHNVHNAAVVVLDPADGAIRALVGSPDYFDQAIDGAVNAALALRQPGSAIKPITYAAAFARGYAPGTMFVDARTSFLTREGAPYVPINYDYRFHGPVLLRQALACSYNVVAVQLLDRIGLDALISTARTLGLTTLGRSEREGLALTLGSCEVQLLQLTAAYASFANGGWRVQPRLINYIEDSAGNVLYRAEPEPAERVLAERIAYLLTDILSDQQARVPTFGEGSVLELPFPAAVKTGTTTEWRDNWTVGYTSDRVVGVWVGNADNMPMLRISGISGAAPIWNAVMRSGHTVSDQGFVRPQGLTEVTICAESGLLPGPACIHRRQELFLAENPPSALCTVHQWLAFDTRTGTVAGADCPVERRELRRVALWSPEVLAWAEGEGLTLPDAELATFVPPPAPAEERVAGLSSTARVERPGIRLTSPDPNTEYLISPSLPSGFQQIEISAWCAPELALKELSLWVDGEPLHTWTGPPYRLWWPLSPGLHEFHVEGVDAARATLRSTPLRIAVHTG